MAVSGIGSFLAARRIFAESAKSARRFVSILSGPLSVQTGVEDCRLVRVTGTAASMLRANEMLCALPCLFTSVRTKKKRGKKERIPKNAEQQETKATLLSTRLEDLADTAETPIAIAGTIRSEVSRALRGRKTARMFAARNKYRLNRLLGLTHDDDSGEGSSEDGRGKVQGRSFITPLTRTQHEADLPRSPLFVSDAVVGRFDFPHSLRYQVAWGGPQVRPRVLSACRVSFRMQDAGLTAAQQKFVAEAVGKDRLCGDLVCLEADVFPSLNQNAALLGDLLETLIRRARSV